MQKGNILLTFLHNSGGKEGKRADSMDICRDWEKGGGRRDHGRHPHHKREKGSTLPEKTIDEVRFHGKGEPSNA